MNPAPQEQAEREATVFHLEVVKARAAMQAILDQRGLNMALAEIELLKGFIVERARQRGLGEGWSR
jgi:hypothetical protein